MAEASPGHCLCGAIQFTAIIEKRGMDACHCEMCRRWGGGPAMAVEATSLEFTGTEPASYRSSEWAERLFCPVCGTGLAWRLADGGFISVPAFLFDPPLDFPLETEIYVDEQPACDRFAGTRMRMTGAEVVALFSDGSDNQGA